MPKNYSSFLSVPYEVGDVLVIYRTWLPDLLRGGDKFIDQDAALNAQWDAFLKTQDGKPFSDEVDKTETQKRCDFKSSRATFKITNIYSYGVGKEITGIIKWSNVTVWPVGETLTFVIDDTTLDKYRLATRMFNPASTGAKKQDNLWRATTETPIRYDEDPEVPTVRSANHYRAWRDKPILNNNIEYHEGPWTQQQKTYSHQCVRLKGNDTNFFTFDYAVQGRLIEFIKRMADKLRGETVKKLDEMGYFTLGLRKKRDVLGGIMSSDVSQEVKWSKDIPTFGSREDMDTNAYFVLSAIGVTRPDELDSGARIASTENINAWEMQCYRSKYAVMEGPGHHLLDRKYRLRMTEDMLYGENPHIEYMYTGSGTTLLDDDGKEVSVIQEIYGFELRSHNRTQPVSSMTFNLHDRATNAFRMPRHDHHWVPSKTGAFRDNVLDRTIMPEPYYAKDRPDETIVDWSASLFIEYKPKSVFITVTEEGKPDDKIFKTVYVPEAYIPNYEPTEPLQYEFLSQKVWGNVLRDAFIKKQGLNAVDPVMRPLQQIETFLREELRQVVAKDQSLDGYDEEYNIFDILGTQQDGLEYQLTSGITAGSYWVSKIAEIKEKIYGDGAKQNRGRMMHLCKELFEPWALKLDPDDLMFKEICDAPQTWTLHGYPEYIRKLNQQMEVSLGLDTHVPEFSPDQKLSIIQCHVATLNAKGVQTKYDMMNRPGKDYTQIWSGGIRNLREENAYLEIHIGKDRVYESTRGKKSPLSDNLIETFSVHLNSVSVLVDAQNHTEELISSRMEIWKKRLEEYPEQMSFSMIHSVLADSNKAIDKAKCIALIKQYIPNQNVIIGENSIAHANTLPKEALKDLVLQESGQAESMNLNQSLWDFILYVIGGKFAGQLNIPDGSTIAKLRQYVHSFRLTVRDSDLSSKRIDMQQKAYTEGTLVLEIGQMDEYFENVSGHTFVLSKLNAKDLNKSVGYHLKKLYMAPENLMGIGGFSAVQCTNYNIEVTMEPQQRRTYNAVEIVMNTAVGPYVSKARQIPSKAWDQTYKPALAKIRPECGTVVHVGDNCNTYQPPNQSRETRGTIMTKAGFYWDDNGQLCNMADRVEGAEPLMGKNSWDWVKTWRPWALRAMYEPNVMEVRALEERATFKKLVEEGKIEGQHHLEDTEDLHRKRKDIIRNTFEHVRNLDTLRFDVYRKVPRSQKTIARDWKKYQKSQYAKLKEGLKKASGTKDAMARELILRAEGVLTPEQYESEGNSLVGPFQSAEPYADETGQPGKMENDFWEMTDDDIETELDKDNYGRVGYLLNHFIRSRRCYQMDIANKWFKSTLSAEPNAQPHEKYALSLEGKFNYLRWKGSGLSTTVGQNGTGTWYRSGTYLLEKKPKDLFKHQSSDWKEKRKENYLAEIKGPYQAETQVYCNHTFSFIPIYNKGINWRARQGDVKFFSITDLNMEWTRNQFTPFLRVQGLVHIIDNIIYKKIQFVKDRMKETNRRGQDQLDVDIQLMGKSSVENLIEKVWDVYSGFKGLHHVRMTGRSDYDLQTVGFPENIGYVRLQRLLDWKNMRRLFNVKITLPGGEPAYIYKDNVYVRNFFYLWRLKDKNKLNIDFGKFKLEFELRCEKVLRKNYGKLMGMGSLATYRGVDQTKAGLFLEENLPANEKFLSVLNQHSPRWRLYDDHFFDQLRALFEINGFIKIDVPIAESYKPVAILDKDTKTQRMGKDGKPMIRMAPIDGVTYSMMGLWRKVETLTAARATQINNSDRVQNAMGEMYDFWNSLPTIDTSLISEDWSEEQVTNHIMEKHPELRTMKVPADETAETALGIPFTECVICGQPGATVFLGRCSKNKDRPHCYHMSCLYDTIIKNPGQGGTSWQYKAINLDQEMSYITTPAGTAAQTIYRDGRLTIREFLKLRSNMVEREPLPPGKITKQQSVIIPLHVDEAVPCGPAYNGQQRRWFINAGRNHKRTVCGYFDDQHAARGDWYADIPMFKWRGLLAGHADRSTVSPFKNTGSYVDENGGQEFHGTVTMTPNTSKCSECQMKFGSRILCAFPRKREVLSEDGTTFSYQYAGQRVTEYGAEGLRANLFFGDVPKRTDVSTGAYDFNAYGHKYLLMKYEINGRAEIESPRQGQWNDGFQHGQGALELHVYDVSSYLESSPYNNNRFLKIPYDFDKNIPQVLYPTPMLPGLEHPLIRKREEERGVKRQRAQPSKILYGQPVHLAKACLAKTRGKGWKDNLMTLFNKTDPNEGGKMTGPYTDVWSDSRGGPWAVYDPQSEEVEIGNSNSSTTKRPAETRIPGTGEIVELPVYAYGTGSVELQARGEFNITTPNPDDIKRIEKWCKLVEEQVGAVAIEEKKEAQTGYEQWRDEILARNPGAKTLAETKKGLKARFTVIPPGRPIKMNMEFDNFVSRADFIKAVKNNIRPVPTKAKLEVWIPNDETFKDSIMSIEELTKRWFKTPTWPETIEIDEEMLGTVVEVPIFERDMDLEFPVYELPDDDEDKKKWLLETSAQQQLELKARVRRYNDVKNHPDINTVEVTKIEYMGQKITKYNPQTRKDEAVGFFKVYDGTSPSSGDFYLKDNIKKPKMRQKPEEQDQLPWFTPEYTEPFMVRCRPKNISQQAKRMKVELAFVEEGDLDATIQVNKCNMTVDIPKDLECCFLGEYLLKCSWFQNPNCWIHKDAQGYPTLPDGRKLFKLNKLVSSSKNLPIQAPEAYDMGDGTFQLYQNRVDYDEEDATFFGDDIKNLKINLIGKKNEQNSREEEDDGGNAISNEFDIARHLDHAGSGESNITFEQLINDSLDWPGDYEQDDWFWVEGRPIDKKMYGQLGIPSPYSVSQLESNRKCEKYDPDCTKHGLTILIQVPKINKYQAMLDAGETYEWPGRMLNFMVDNEGAQAVNTNTGVATVTFHDWDGTRVTENTGREQVAIPLSYLTHEDDATPSLPMPGDKDRWRKLYNWANILSTPGRVFGDDRFFTQDSGDWGFNGRSNINDRFYVDSIGERGGHETLAICAQIRTHSEEGIQLGPKKLILAHEACMARSFFTVIMKEDDSHYLRTYEEKYDVLPVSKLMPQLRAKRKIIPLSTYTQPGIAIREEGFKPREGVANMKKQMKQDGLNPSRKECIQLANGFQTTSTGWSNALTDGVMGLDKIERKEGDLDPLEAFDNVYRPDYCTAFLTLAEQNDLQFNPKQELFIDVVRSVGTELRGRTPEGNRRRRPPPAPQRSIGFDFVLVGPHAQRNDNGYYNACGHEGTTDNIRHFRGSKLHDMFLPIEKNIQGKMGECGFGFKDIHWHDFLQELPNVFCAEIACGGWKLQEKEDEDWVDTQYPKEKRMEILLDQIEYVGTLIMRDDRTYHGKGQIANIELFHLSPNREHVPFGPQAHFKLSVDEQEFVSLGISPRNDQIPHSMLYCEDMRVAVGAFQDTEEEYLRKRILNPISTEEYLKKTNGCGVAQSAPSLRTENLIFNNRCWSDKDETKNVYLNRACGVFGQPDRASARSLPIRRGISYDGNGYNIQRALFALNNSIDGWRTNPATDDDFQDGNLIKPHFVIGVRLKNPEKYRLINPDEKSYDFNKDVDDSASSSSDDDIDDSDDDDGSSNDEGPSSDNVYNLAIDANSTAGEAGVQFWPQVNPGDIVHCAYPDPVYRVRSVDNGYVNLEQVEDPQQTVEDYVIDDLTFIHRGMTYPDRQHERIIIGTFCRIRLGSMLAPGADAIQANAGVWSVDNRFSEKVYRIERFGYGNRAPLRADFERIAEDEDLPDINDELGDDGPIGATHQIILRDTTDYGMEYRMFQSVIAFVSDPQLRIFGPPDEMDSDADEAAEEDIMGQYNYEGTNQRIKLGDIVMYQPVDNQTAVRLNTQGGALVRGNRFNVKDPREYSIVDINYNGDQTTLVLKLSQYTKLWDRSIKKSQRIVGVSQGGLDYIQFIRNGYNPIAMNVAIDRYEQYRKMPLTVGTLVSRCLRSGAPMNEHQYIITGVGPMGTWQGHNDGVAVELIRNVFQSSEAVPGSLSMTVNTTFLRWVGYQEPWVEGRHFKIGSRWGIQFGTEPSTLHEVIAVHRSYLGEEVINGRLSGTINMREAFNHIVVRNYGTDRVIQSIDLENFTGTFTAVTGQAPYENLQAKDWPEFIAWQEPDDGLVFTSESSEEDADLEEMDSRLSKITLKF